MPSERRPEGSSLTEREVSDIRAVRGSGSARDMLALVERIVSSRTVEAAARAWDEGAMARAQAEPCVSVKNMNPYREPERPVKMTWTGLFGIDPDFCEGKDIDEWLEENRGNA